MSFGRGRRLYGMRTNRWLRLLLLPLSVPLLGVIACEDDPDAAAANEIDGSWRVDRFTCDGQARQIPVLTVNIAGDGGTFVIEIPQACTATITEAYAFPRAGTITISPKGSDCRPDAAACAPAFGGATTCPTPPPTEFTYARNGNALTFERTSAGPPVDTCPAGQAVEYQMTKL